MSLLRGFLDYFLSLWRKYRLQDLRSIYLACAIFIAGCILATLSWKLGAPLVFVLIYVVLGTCGFLLIYLNRFKLMPEIVTEKLPLLLPSLRFRDACYPNEEYKATKTETFLDVDAKSEVSSASVCNMPTINKGEINEHSPSEVPVAPEDCDREIGSIVKCVQSSYNSRITHEEYATGPSPGIGQSRKSDGDRQKSSRQKRLPPLSNLVKTSSTEPSAQFHVSLSDVAHSQKEVNPASVLEPLSSGAQAEAEKEVQWVSTNPHEPIYQNIVPYPPRRKILSETDLLKSSQYDIPSNELRSVEEVTKKMSTQSRTTSVDRNVYVTGGSSRRDGTRFNAFTSPERRYVNVIPLEGRQNEKIQDDKTQRDQCPKSTDSFSSTRYISDNISPKIERAEQTEEACKTTRHFDRHDRAKSHELWTINAPKVQLVSSNEHQDQKDSLSLGKNTPIAMGEGEHRSPLLDDAIYENVSTLKCQIKTQTSTGRDRDNDYQIKTEKQPRGTETASSLSKSENIYVNLSFRSENSSVLKGKTSPIKKQWSYDSECSVDTEIEDSTSGEYEDGTANQTKTEPEKENEYSHRSEYMYVTGLGPTFKSYVRPGALGSQSLHSDSSEHNFSLNPDEIICNEIAVDDKYFSQKEVDSKNSRPEQCKKAIQQHPDEIQAVVLPSTGDTISKHESELIRHYIRKSSGLNIGSYSLKAACTDTTENESPERKHVYENPLYEAGKSTTGSTRVGEHPNVERSATEETGKSELNDTYSVETSISSSHLEKVKTNQKLLPIPENQAFSSKQANVITTSDDEDSFYLKKSLSAGETIESKDSLLTALESPSCDMDEYSATTQVLSSKQANISTLEDEYSFSLEKSLKQDESKIKYSQLTASESSSCSKSDYSTTELENFSKQDNVFATSEDEDPFYLQKSLTAGEALKLKISQLTTSESCSKDDYSTGEQAISSKQANVITTSEDSSTLHRSLTEDIDSKDIQFTASESFSSSTGDGFHQPETKILKSTNPESIFSPRKGQLTSKSGRTSTKSMHEHSSGRVSFYTPIEITSLRSTRIFPPLDRSYSGTGLRASLRHPTPSRPIDLPVILNRSSFVQSQLQKFSALSRDSAKPLTKRPVQLSRGNPLKSSLMKSSSSLPLPPESLVSSSSTSSLQSSSTSGQFLHSEPQAESPGTPASTDIISGSPLTSPSMASLLSKIIDQSSDTTPPKTKEVADEQSLCDVPDTTTGQLPESSSKQTDETSGENPNVKRHSPVYF